MRWTQSRVSSTLRVLEKVTFGPGKAASLGPELERRGLKRALIVTGKTLGGSRLLDKVTAAAGSRLAGVFKGASQHVPSHTVAALVEEYKRSGADSMVSFGGGSPIDTVKVAAKRILEGDRPGSSAAHTIDFEAADVVGGPDLIHIAMPTTLSAGEFTPIGGSPTRRATSRAAWSIRVSRRAPSFSTPS